MATLAEKHPDVFAEFKLRNFVVHKTSNKFSAMALDQSHEQNNAMVKGSGGAIGLTGNPGALRRWMVAFQKSPDLQQSLRNRPLSNIMTLNAVIMTSNLGCKQHS